MSRRSRERIERERKARVRAEELLKAESPITRQEVIEIWNSVEGSKDWGEVVDVSRCAQEPDVCLIQGDDLEVYGVISLSRRRDLTEEEFSNEKLFCDASLDWVDVSKGL